MYKLPEAVYSTSYYHTTSNDCVYMYVPVLLIKPCEKTVETAIGTLSWNTKGRQVEARRPPHSEGSKSWVGKSIAVLSLTPEGN